MKKLMMLVLATVMAGCAMFGGTGGPTAAWPGTIMNDTTYPGYAQWEQVDYKARDFEVIGEVTAEVQSSSILGIICSGDSGYISLYKAAKSQGADDVINVKIDTHYYNIMNCYSKVTTKLLGLAIKWKK